MLSDEVASALGPFFDRIGPSHDEITVLVKRAGLTDLDPATRAAGVPIGKMKRVKGNTVQLGSKDPGDGRSGRLGPVLMVCSLHMPLDVLALDEPRVGPVASGGVEAPAEQRDGMSPSALSALRGKNRAPRRSSGERCGARRRS